MLADNDNHSPRRRLRPVHAGWILWAVSCILLFIPASHSTATLLLPMAAGYIMGCEWQHLSSKGDPRKPPYLAAETYDAGYAAAIERAARVVQNGSFLTSDSPEAQWARECAAAIRRESP